jgi:hypothetical protein
MPRITKKKANIAMIPKQKLKTPNPLVIFPPCKNLLSKCINYRTIFRFQQTNQSAEPLWKSLLKLGPGAGKFPPPENAVEIQSKQMNNKLSLAEENRARRLLDRLERISADSPWAYQASGIRASLAKGLSRGTLDRKDLLELINAGFQILEKAASEIPE